MSFFRALFGRSRPDGRANRRLEDHLDFLNTLKLPTIALARTTEEQLSRLGGLPSLPHDVPWPQWQGKPLAFLCQLNLAEIPAECDTHGLRRSGMLYFFYDQEQKTWGFDPKDAGSWRVIYAPEPTSPDAVRPAPAGLAEQSVYSPIPVAFTPVETYPDYQDDRIASLELNNSQSNEYAMLCSSVFGGAPAHHLFGHPSPLQDNDMDLECQLASNGVYCGHHNPENDAQAQALEPGRHDWVLLLQLDTDDDTGMMWGDCGMLYFWIRKDDLARGQFDRCWMILQCS